MMNKILVYGTLKRGQPNHYLLNQGPGSCRYLGQALTRDVWPLVVAGPFNVPYLLDRQGNGRHVGGEVYEVDEEKLAILDDLERHPQLYTRTPIEIRMLTDPDDSEVDAEPEMIEVYLIRNPKEILMENPYLDSYQDNGTYIRPRDRPPSAESWGISDVKYV